MAYVPASVNVQKVAWTRLRADVLSAQFSQSCKGLSRTILPIVVLQAERFDSSPLSLAS